MITGTYEPIKYVISTSRSEFPITFEFVKAAHIRATVTSIVGVDTVLDNTTDFSVTGTTLTTVSPLDTAGEQLTIWMDMPFDQGTEYSNTGNFNLSDVEEGFDEVSLGLQQLSEEVSRALKVSVTSDSDPEELAEDLATQVSIATDQAVIATEQAVLATNQVTLAEGQVTLAEGQVTLAEDQVALATNQVTLAEDQVTLATEQAVIATNAASIAVLAGVPPGASMPFNTETVPDGWLEEDGSAISRTTYSDLFAVIGTVHGEGDGSTTFNVPDSRGKFVRGWDHGAGNDPGAATRTAAGDGVTTGDHVGTKQADQFKLHAHTVQTTGPNGGTVASYGLTGTHIGNPATSSVGGAETRPVNIYKMICIKY